MKDLRINMKHLKPNLLRIHRNSLPFNLSSKTLIRILLSQLMYKLEMLQLHMQRMMQEFHILMLVVPTIQEPQLWIQTHWFGKELTSMMVKSMGIKKEIMTRMISRNMEMTKKLKPTLDSHMLQHFK